MAVAVDTIGIRHLAVAGHVNPLHPDAEADIGIRYPVAVIILPLVLLLRLAVVAVIGIVHHVTVVLTPQPASLPQEAVQVVIIGTQPIVHAIKIQPAFHPATVAVQIITGITEAVAVNLILVHVLVRQQAVVAGIIGILVCVTVDL
jgi:hypothetical protein